MIELETLRSRLHKAIMENDEKQILTISQELDEKIVEFMRSTNQDDPKKNCS